MNWTIAGLPLHPLVVHVVVVAVPLSVLLTVLVAAWPAARRRIGLGAPIVALVALIAVPIATSAGEALERQVDHSALVEEHTRLGDTMLPWAIAVFAISLAQWLWYSFGTHQPGVRRFRTLITVVLAVVVAVSSLGSIVTVVRIGDSGARAVWSGEK